jgi:FkbM family methyltransferase
MLRTLWSAYKHTPPWLKGAVRRGAAVMRLALRPFVSAVRMDGFRMHLDLRDNASIRYLRWGDAYERDLRTLFLQLVGANPGALVVDVGASYGPYALAAAALSRYVPVQRIIAIEPDERCYQALQRSVRDNGFQGVMMCLHALAGDVSGTALLIGSEAASTSNRSFQSSEESGVFVRGKTTSMPVIRLDTEIPRLLPGSPRKLVVKLDVEGSETRVLRGFQHLLRETPGVALLFEIYPIGMHEVGFDVEDLLSVVEPLPWDRRAVREGESMQSFPDRESFSAFMRAYYASNVAQSAAVDVILLRGLDMPASSPIQETK